VKLTHLWVKNFKGLRDIEIPLARFVCLIGQNNAGKSSLMQALLIFIEGRKLDPTMYFEAGLPIRIAVKFEEISEDDLALIPNEEHRKRFAECLVQQSITLVRRYDPDGSSRLEWIARVPNDSRFQPEAVDSLLDGKRPGAAFASELAAVFPEIAERVDPKTNQKQARLLIEEVAAGIPDAEKSDKEMELKSGIDNSIRSLLPEPIYIAAVKDLADEIATKDSASFGKLLAILLTQIAPQLETAEETFKNLKTQLNRVTQPDGSVLDTRLEAVRNIETVLQGYVRENFPRVELDLRIPPPEIKTVLSSAEIWVNDGVLGLVDSKGDGLKRTVTFSILRTYIALRRMQKLTGEASRKATNYVFLFEEPELYLHPTAQRILFEALTEISKTNHVLVSTHSPLFFSPEATGIFIKLAKKLDRNVALKPFGEALWVDLGSMDQKSKFQLISYETNNTAFFYQTVVLVEGDCELLVFPHLARVMDQGWGSDQTAVAFCRIGGKGNIARYRDFFTAFDVRVCVVADLDCILEGFEQLGASDACTQARARLLQSVDAFIEANRVEGKISSREIRDLQTSEPRQRQFQELKETITRYKENSATIAEVNAAEELFFAELVNSKRRKVVEESTDATILAQKRELLRLLRELDVFILERGTIEDYYPSGVSGPDKPSKALDFCSRVRTREDVLALCDDVPTNAGGQPAKELSVILSAIYAET